MYLEGKMGSCNNTWPYVSICHYYKRTSSSTLAHIHGLWVSLYIGTDRYVWRFIYIKTSAFWHTCILKHVHIKVGGELNMGYMMISPSTYSNCNNPGECNLPIWQYPPTHPELQVQSPGLEHIPFTQCGLQIAVVHLVPVHPLLQVQIPGLEHHPLLHPPLHTGEQDCPSPV